MARRITTSLADLAAGEFTPAGCARIWIDANAHCRQYVDTQCVERSDWTTHPERFDPQAVWADLEAQHGGGKGAEEAYRHAAEGLRDLFNILAGAAIEQRRKGVVLCLPVLLDRIGKTFRENRLYWSSQEAVQQVLTHLRTFAVWSQDDTGMLAGIAEMERLFAPAQILVVSRHRFKIGSAIEMTTYHVYFEFLISHAVAAKLQVFLGLYGQMARDAAQSRAVCAAQEEAVRIHPRCAARRNGAPLSHKDGIRCRIGSEAA